jgi:hypothetical protein
MLTFKEYLAESSINRFTNKFKNHDAAIITAYRGEHSHKENQERNKKLFSGLYAKGYSVTSVKGSYIENKGHHNEKEVSEHSFVVVNHKHDPDFHKNIKKMCEHFNQDSVLLIHKGEKPKATLVGTSKESTSFPGYGNKHEFSHMTLNTKNHEFFTRLHKKTFTFPESPLKESDLYESEYYPETINGKYAAKIEGAEFLQELNIKI